MGSILIWPPPSLLNVWICHMMLPPQPNVWIRRWLRYIANETVVNFSESIIVQLVVCSLSLSNKAAYCRVALHFLDLNVMWKKLLHSLINCYYSASGLNLLGF